MIDWIMYDNYEEKRIDYDKYYEAMAEKADAEYEDNYEEEF